MSTTPPCPRTGKELACLLVLRALALLDEKSIKRAFPSDSTTAGLVDEAVERIDWLRDQVNGGALI